MRELVHNLGKKDRFLTTQTRILSKFWDALNLYLNNNSTPDDLLNWANQYFGQGDRQRQNLGSVSHEMFRLQTEEPFRRAVSQDLLHYYHGSEQHPNHKITAAYANCIFLRGLSDVLNPANENILVHFDLICTIYGGTMMSLFGKLDESLEKQSYRGLPTNVKPIRNMMKLGRPSAITQGVSNAALTSNLLCQYRIGKVHFYPHKNCSNL